MTNTEREQLKAALLALADALEMVATVLTAAGNKVEAAGLRLQEWNKNRDH